MTDKETKVLLGVCKRVLKMCKSMEKKKGITDLERNSIRSTLRLVESTLQINNPSVIKSNLIVSMKALLDTGIAKVRYQEFLKEHVRILSTTQEDSKREKILLTIEHKINSSNTGEKSQGYLELRSFIKGKNDSVGETYLKEAVNYMNSKDRELALRSSMYAMEVINQKPSLFEEYRTKFVSGINSDYPEVRVLCALIFSKAGKTDTIDSLLSLSEDRNEVNVNELELPSYSRKFPVEHGLAKVKDIANECIFTIIDSTGNSSNYVTSSVSYYVSGARREGEEFFLILKVKPVVKFGSLTINLSKLNTLFDLHGRTQIVIENIEQGTVKEVEIRAIPKSSGQLKSTISIRTDQGISGDINIEEFFEPKFEKRSADTAIQSSNGSKDHNSLDNMDRIELILKDVRTMDTKNVISALEQLKSLVSGDDIYENRIAAMAVNFSLKGTDRITKSEMDSIVEMVQSIGKKIGG